MFHGPHFETKTDGVSPFRDKKRSVRRGLLAAVPAVVLILILGSFALLTYASGTYARFIGADQERVSVASDAEPTAGLGQILTMNPSAAKDRAGSSGEDVRGRVATLRKGELLLTVPRLGLRDVRVATGSTQKKLDREGIIRLQSSGQPSSEGSNTYIVGHRVGFPQTKIPYVFYKLDKLRPRDKIVVVDHSGTKYVYEVYDHRTVPPAHYWLTHAVEGKTIISLQTCTPIPSFEDRLIVRGELVSVSSS